MNNFLFILFINLLKYGFIIFFLIFYFKYWEVNIDILILLCIYGIYYVFVYVLFLGNIGLLFRYVRCFWLKIKIC